MTCSRNARPARTPPSTPSSRRRASWTKSSPERNFSNLRDAIGTNSLTNFIAFSVGGERDPNRAILNRLQREASGKIKLGLDLRGGTSFLIGIDTNKMAQTVDKKALVGQAIEVLRKRVDKFGVAEPMIVAEGEDRIVIQMPGQIGRAHV